MMGAKSGLPQHLADVLALGIAEQVGPRIARCGAREQALTATSFVARTCGLWRPTGLVPTQALVLHVEWEGHSFLLVRLERGASYCWIQLIVHLLLGQHVRTTTC